MPAGFRTLVCAAFVAWQAAAPSAPIQERLERVRAELYSRTDRLAENVTELKQILALDPRSAAAHMLLGIAYSTLGSKELTGAAIGEFRPALRWPTPISPWDRHMSRRAGPRTRSRR